MRGFEKLPLFVTLPASAAVTLASAILPDLTDFQRRVGLAFAGLLFLWSVGALGWHYWRERQRSNIPDAPGFTLHAVVRFGLHLNNQRRYVFEFGDEQGLRVSLYISAADVFTFAVTDASGESYPLEIPLNRNGIRFGEVIDLSAAVGIFSQATVLRVAVNGRAVAKRALRFPISAPPIKWVGAMGSNVAGKDGAIFDMYEWAMWDHFLGTKAEQEASLAVRKNWQLEKG
jgi:hypothetical protein